MKNPSKEELIVQYLGKHFPRVFINRCSGVTEFVCFFSSLKESRNMKFSFGDSWLDSLSPYEVVNIIWEKIVKDF